MLFYPITFCMRDHIFQIKFFDDGLYWMHIHWNDWINVFLFFKCNIKNKSRLAEDQKSCAALDLLKMYYTIKEVNYKIIM